MRRPALLLAALTLAATACSALFEAPSVRIADVRVSGVGLSGATADITLAVVNPNAFTLRSEEVRYVLEFDDPAAREAGDDDPWRTIAEGSSVERLEVLRDDSARVTLSVPFAYSDVGRAVRSLMLEQELRYRVRGDVLFDGPVGDVRVPFDDTGRIGI